MFADILICLGLIYLEDRLNFLDGEDEVEVEIVVRSAVKTVVKAPRMMELLIYSRYCGRCILVLQNSRPAVPNLFLLANLPNRKKENSCTH